MFTAPTLTRLVALRGWVAIYLQIKIQNIIVLKRQIISLILKIYYYSRLWTCLVNMFNFTPEYAKKMIIHYVMYKYFFPNAKCNSLNLSLL